MAGWAGEGGGRFGERREYEAPTLPSTPRQHGMARHYTRQAINNTPCQHGTAPHTSAEKQHTTTNVITEAATRPTQQHKHQKEQQKK